MRTFFTGRLLKDPIFKDVSVLDELDDAAIIRRVFEVRDL